MQITEEFVASLLKRIDRLETRLRHVEKSRAKLIREKRRLRQDNALLKEKTRELTARLNSDSTNSSKPPSSDKPWSERRVQKPSGRPSGAQPGHVGKTRPTFSPEQVDHKVSVVRRNCGKCGHRLGENHTTGQVRRHQVVEIPPVVAEVTEYALHESKCPGCGHAATADLPEGVPNSCAGVRFQAILSLLTGRCRITRREAREVAAELFGPKALVSLGTIGTLERRTSNALRPAYDEALDAIQSADFVNCDETSWRQSNKLAWLWAAVTPMLKVFRIDRRRNREAFRKLLLSFDGILSSDRFSVYRAHAIMKRQLCWAHLLRNFLGLEERGGTARSLGIGGQKIVKAVFKEWYRFREGELTRNGLRRRLAPIRLRLKRLLQRHVKNSIPAASKIAKDLRDYGAALWTFARVEGVEPTNNAAERAVRKAVLWRKTSFGSASRWGSRFAERMLTVCESLRAQGRSILDFLEDAIRARLIAGPTPSLLTPA